MSTTVLNLRTVQRSGRLLLATSVCCLLRSIWQHWLTRWNRILNKAPSLNVLIHVISTRRCNCQWLLCYRLLIHDLNALVINCYWTVFVKDVGALPLWFLCSISSAKSWASLQMTVTNFCSLIELFRGCLDHSPHGAVLLGAHSRRGCRHLVKHFFASHWWISRPQIYFASRVFICSDLLKYMLSMRHRVRWSVPSVRVSRCIVISFYVVLSGLLLLLLSNFVCC